MGFSIAFTPESAQFPSTNFPALTTVNTTERIFSLAFDTTTSESCMWRNIVPQSPGTTWTAVISYIMASATTGSLAFTVAVQSVTSADALDIDTTTSYDTANSGSDSGVPGTAGYMEQISITLTNMDSASAGDWITFKLARDVANDTATGDALVLAVEIRNA